MPGHPYAAALPNWISPGRFEPYLRAAGDDVDTGCEVYEWSASLTSVSFQAIHYVEVLTRNAIDTQMRAYLREDRAGIPWFLLPVTKDKSLQDRIDRDIDRVRQRLRNENARKEIRGQIIAGLSFGFWAHLLGPKHDQLWRDALHKAFPNSSGRRADVASAMFTLNKFRNRLAHHDSLLAADVPFRLSQMLDVMRWIDPNAAAWLTSTEQVTAVHATRPTSRRDTVVVAATHAWPLYRTTRAYVCQSGRSFQPVDHLAFYSAGQIHREVPKILFRIDHVDWTDAEVRRLRATGDPRDAWIAEVIEQSRAARWSEGRYQVFLLTHPGQEGHLTLKSSIPHSARGRGSAFTQSQRYVVRDALRRATSTATLS